eukprot:FR744065.1.p1 GENE.FR744065.1~~FR744065.1.p1  ORF type:complete len:118 (-),score=19.15 FR744065.1:464-817(-)
MFPNRKAGQEKQIQYKLVSSLLRPPRPFPFCSWFVLWKEVGADINSTQETGTSMSKASAQLTLNKRNKSWTSPAGAVAIELMDSLGSGPWLSLRAVFFFFFFFARPVYDFFSALHSQ